MTNEKSSTVKRLGKRFKSTTSLEHHNLCDPFTGVTPENYRDLGNAFLASGRKPFTIARAQCKVFSEHAEVTEIEPTIRQWGAWLAYFLRKRIHQQLMATRDWFTVPAEWPHLFDVEATVIQDHLAGDAFQKHFVPDIYGRRRAYFTPDEQIGFRVKAWAPPAREPFRPFPALWAAFRGDAEALARLDSGLVFEALEETHKRFIASGHHAARGYLMNQYPPPLPASVRKLLPNFPQDPKRRKTPDSHLDASKPPEPWMEGASPCRLLQTS